MKIAPIILAHNGGGMVGVSVMDAPVYQWPNRRQHHTISPQAIRQMLLVVVEK